jgi:hypothetical protein
MLNNIGKQIFALVALLSIMVVFILALVFSINDNSAQITYSQMSDKPVEELASISASIPAPPNLTFAQSLAPLAINIADLPIIVIGDDYTITVSDYRQTISLRGG